MLVSFLFLEDDQRGHPEDHTSEVCFVQIAWNY